MSATYSLRLANRSCQCRILPRTQPYTSQRRCISSSNSLLAQQPPQNSDGTLIPGSAKALEHVKDPGGAPKRTQETNSLLALAMERTSQKLGRQTSDRKFKKVMADITDMVLDGDKLALDIEKNERKILAASPDFAEFRDPNSFRSSLRQKIGFMNLGEEKKDDPMEDPEFEEDDMSSLAHGELEQHRELREYARLAAWEMPLLTKMAKPFEPPTMKQVLRFRYTTYMGEQHPAEKKVVVEFCPADMPELTDIQKEKLKKLAGVRWNPQTDIIKMSCEMFETQAQNKRYLGDLVDVLLKEAKDPTDTFEDVPLDTRHHPMKVKPKFPAEWRMTEQRRALLEAEREQSRLLTEDHQLKGAVIDGIRQIEGVHASLDRLRIKNAPVTVPVGKETKGRRLAVRR